MDAMKVRDEIDHDSLMQRLMLALEGFVKALPIGVPILLLVAGSAMAGEAGR